MKPELTQDMVDGCDDMAGLYRFQPAFPTIASAKGISVPAAKIQRIRGLQTIVRHGISVQGREQGQADTDRRDALKRANI